MKDYFKNQLELLRSIADSCEELRFQISFESKVLEAEKTDRFLKHLKGVEAIEHFNSYMSRFGLDHLVIELGDE